MTRVRKKTQGNGNDATFSPELLTKLNTQVLGPLWD